MFDHHYNLSKSSKVSANKMSEETAKTVKRKLNIHKQCGFSIVELMIAVIMLSVLLAVGTPAFIGMSQENTLAEASNRFVSSITLARNEAVSRNRNVIMCQLNDSLNACDFDNTWEDGWIIWVDLDDNNTMDVSPFSEEVIHRETALPTGYSIAPTQNQFRNRITFSPTGEATGDGGSGLEIFRLCGTQQPLNNQSDNEKARLIYLNGVGHAWINRTRGLTAGIANCPE